MRERQIPRVKSAARLLIWILAAILACTSTVSLAEGPGYLYVKNNCFTHFEPSDWTQELPQDPGRYAFGEASFRQFLRDLQCDCTSGEDTFRQLHRNVDTLLGREPTNPYVWLAASELLLRQHALESGPPKANKSFQLALRAAQLGPSIGVADLTLAKGALATGSDFSAVWHVYQAGKNGAPEDELLYVRGLMSSSLNNISEARHAYEEVLRISTATDLKVLAATELGDLLRREGKQDEAAKHYKYASELGFCSTIPNRRLASLFLFDVNDPAAAKSVISKIGPHFGNYRSQQFYEIIEFYEWSQSSASSSEKDNDLKRLLRISEIGIDEVFLTAARANNGKQLIVDLLDAGVLSDLDPTDGYTNTPLIIAARDDADDVAALLVDRGANVNAQNANGERAIGYFSSNGNANAVQLLINSGAEINYVDGAGNSPLDLAIQAGHTDTTELLLRNGANTDVSESLMKACLAGNASMVKLLLSIGADANAKSDNSVPPLLAALLSGDLPTLRLLLDKDADPSAMFRGKSVLEYAVDAGDAAAVKLLTRRMKTQL